MPKITNRYYAQFQKEGYIDIVTKSQFEEWLNNIANQKLPQKCTLQQARALFIALVYLGRRPSEIADIKGNTVEKVKLDGKYYYKFDIKTLKKGKQSPIFRPINEYTKELFDYIKNRPNEMYAFWAFRKENKNTVKWKTRKQIITKQVLADGTSTIHQEPYIENKSKTYIRKGGLINYYSTLWTNRPAYWFRHNRYSTMYAEGANDIEVQLDKGATDPKSVNAYKHMSKKVAKSIIKTFKF